MKAIIKSPLNYVGNKSRLMPQLRQLFPKDINIFLDLFTGGADVVANIEANIKYANDINYPVVEILQSLQSMSINDILDYVDKRIFEFNLTKTNEEGFLKYREMYNKGVYNTPLDLFILSKFSYNQIIRFNKKMEYNSSFGRNRSDFNDNIRNNTIAFCQLLSNINFMSEDFRKIDISNYSQNDFVYADPPYLIARADYNIGKTAMQKWDNKDEYDLYNFLEHAPCKWAFSNFLKHNDKTNSLLEEWIMNNNYNVYSIQANYSKIIPKIERTNNPTVEVLITNYTIMEDNNYGTNKI